MAIAKSSPLLKVIGIGFGLMALFLIYKAFSPDEGPVVSSEGTLRSAPTVGGLEEETKDETIRTLTAQIKQLSDRLEEVSTENQQVLQQSTNIERRVEGTLRQTLQEEQQKTRQAIEEKVEETKEESKSLIDRLSQEFDQRVTVQPGQPGAPSIPVGEPGAPGTVPSYELGDEIEWITPLGEDVGAGLSAEAGGDFGQVSFAEEAPSFGGDASFGEPAQAGTEGEAAALQGPTGTVPVHTIPENATLMDSIAMTALVGRVPFEGSVSDPLRFKVLIGAANLATNGIDIPGVRGMIASGVAVGDWTLGCVRGNIDSLTFTYEDGTIHTVSGQGNLGTLSDPAGVPCIPGERISNASQFLVGRLLSAGFAALSEAVAKAETEEEPSADIGGQNATNITGDAGVFAIFQAGKGAAEELGEYLKERQAQTFDAIFVQAGAEVAIHIEKQINIDFNPQGRKVFHGSQNLPANLGGLD